MIRGVFSAVVIGGVAFVLFTVCALAADSRPSDDLAQKLEGTWEWTPEKAPEYRGVKIVNRTHFMFAMYHKKSGRAVMVAGGTCSLQGQTYREKMEFGSDVPGLLELIGKEQVFTATVKDDEWVYEGTLPDGARVREVLKRVKQPNESQRDHVR